MSEKTLKFDDIEVNKKGFHASKLSIALDLLDINQIKISNKFKHSDKVIKVLNILLAKKMMILLDLYVLFYLK